MHFIHIEFLTLALPTQLRPPPMLLLRDFCCCVYFLNSQTKAGVDGRVGQEGRIKVVPGADQSASHVDCCLLFLFLVLTHGGLSTADMAWAGGDGRIRCEQK